MVRGGEEGVIMARAQVWLKASGGLLRPSTPSRVAPNPYPGPPLTLFQNPLQKFLKETPQLLKPKEKLAFILKTCILKDFFYHKRPILGGLWRFFFSIAEKRLKKFLAHDLAPEYFLVEIGGQKYCTYIK